MSFGPSVRNGVALGLGSIPSLQNAPPYASLNLRFSETTTLDPRITFTRASTGTYVDSAGALQTAAIDAPRFDYSPTTLAPLGLLIEEARTNSIRNNTMQGAVAGTPGTIPTNWGATGGGLGTLTQTIVGIGTQNGINYIDYRFFGTTSTTTYGNSFETSTQIVAAPGQTWTGSCYFNIVGGSTANISAISIANAGRSSVGGTLEFFPGPDIKGTTSLTRYALTSTLVNASTARISNSFIISFASGVAIDITVRIGLPQLELGVCATSVIPTTTTALTRAADVAYMTGTNFSSWFNPVEGSFAIQYDTVKMIGTASVLSLFAATTVDRLVINDNNSVRRMVVIDDNLSQFSSDTFIGSDTSGTVAKVAHAYAASNYASVANNGTVYSQASGTVPTLIQMYIGASQTVTNQITGHIRSIAYYPRRLPNAELQALTV